VFPTPDGRIVVVSGLPAAPMLNAALARHASQSGNEAWRVAGIAAGVATITAATTDLFVPQMVNWDLVGGVSFRKGCYPGQEIVARTQYRGILKRRMALAHVAGAERPMPGEPVYSGAFGEQAAGAIVNAAPAPGGGYDALVVAQLEALASGDLHLGAPTGPALEVRERPYEQAAAEQASSMPR
jgi:folate-binding protein YgfZ